MFTLNPLTCTALVEENHPVDNEGFFRKEIQCFVEDRSIKFSIIKTGIDGFNGNMINNKKKIVHEQIFNYRLFRNYEIRKQFISLMDGEVILKNVGEIVNLCFISLVLSKEYEYEIDNTVWFEEFPWLITYKKNIIEFYNKELNRLIKLIGDL